MYEWIATKFGKKKFFPTLRKFFTFFGCDRENLKNFLSVRKNFFFPKFGRNTLSNRVGVNYNKNEKKSFEMPGKIFLKIFPSIRKKKFLGQKNFFSKFFFSPDAESNSKHTGAKIIDF